jgi:hypothetical protein
MANIKENKRFHYTYKTTNLINGRYYLGMHSTNRIDDGYLGSGKRLYYELNKYGRNNFNFEILVQFESREQLVQAEINLITEQDLKNPNCLNLKQGGTGGFSKEVSQKGQKAGVLSRLEKSKNNPEYKAYISDQRSDLYANSLGKFKGHAVGTFLGKTHTEESRKKMSEAKKGKGTGKANSQFGTRWITNGTENKKIKKEEWIPTGWKLGKIK